MYKLRIITGKWRNRKVTFYPSDSLKPTTDKVRETLFNWLSPLIAERRCLDLFAGSAILSFEALSRGAAHATIVEKTKKNAYCIQENSINIGVDNSVIDIYNKDALQFLKTTPEQSFDLIFLDPPYQSTYITQCCDLILHNNWLNTTTGLLYCESNKPITPPAGLIIYKQQQAGNIYFYLLSPHQTFGHPLPQSGEGNANGEEQCEKRLC
ncbi:MAG: 16S rRNA (guanine(966)-N(2))-methyltransferase RsmD [Legionellales bacterium]|nr:MAG: 16S rRNA (guanine(966)-N(2))-methyltransferase RsmD [Legionellales bacterium]